MGSRRLETNRIDIFPHSSHPKRLEFSSTSTVTCALRTALHPTVATRTVSLFVNSRVWSVYQRLSLVQTAQTS